MIENCHDDCGSCFRNDTGDDECDQCPIGMCNECPHPCEEMLMRVPTSDEVDEYMEMDAMYE